jgi:hypothetical protein
LEKAVAQKILQAALALDVPLGTLDTLLSTIPDELERAAFARNLANVIREVNESFIRPIARQFPELDPDK